MCKVPKRLQTLKMDFMERMRVFFVKEAEIPLNELSYLLNDLFINEMSSYIRSKCEDIIPNVIEEYKECLKQQEKIEEML